MDRNGILAVFLLFFVVADVSNASLFWRFRKLVDDTPKDNSTAVQVSPSPTSVSGGKKSDPKPTSTEKSNEKKPKEPQVPNNPSNSDPNESNKTDSVNPSPQYQTDNEKNKNNTEGSNRADPVSQPPQNQMDNEKNKKGTSKTDPVNPPHQIQTENGKNKEGSGTTDLVRPPPSQNEKGLNKTKDLVSPPPVNRADTGKSKKNDDKANSQSGNSETCTGLPKCTDEKALVACIESPKSGSKEWVILVQNEGEQPLKVTIVASTSVENPFKELEIPKHQTERVNISLTNSKSNKLILDAGHGDCVLHMDPPVSEGNFFLHLPSYEKLVTPINGAYFLILTVLVFGGTWACCMCMKRKRQGGIPYQELEMGLPESFSANDVETAEGWDQGWDDDWDEDNAVKSPGGHHVRNISANGLTSRSSNRDGWENDWDD